MEDQDNNTNMAPIDEDSDFETTHCLVAVDNLFDVAVLVFEALVGVLQLIEAVQVGDRLFIDAYCNGTNRKGSPREEFARVCDTEAYWLDRVLELDNRDLMVAQNFAWYSGLCLVAIGLIGLYVYVRELFNILTIAFTYFFCFIMLLLLTIRPLVGLIFLPFVLVAKCFGDPYSFFDLWWDVFAVGYIGDSWRRFIGFRPPNCNEVVHMLNYPYSKRAVLTLENFVRRISAGFLNEEDSAEIEEQYEREDEMLSDWFRWARGARKIVLINLMKFGNLIYQVSDITRDIVFLSILSKYSTGTPLLGIDLGTTTIIDIFFSILLILKLGAELGSHILEWPPDMPAASEHYSETQQQLDDGADSKSSDEPDPFAWIYEAVYLTGLIMFNMFASMLFIQMCIWTFSLCCVAVLLRALCSPCLAVAGYGKE